MNEEKRRILLVDDEPINIAVLANLLEESYTLTVAKSGPQALQRAAADPPPDLILLDVMMPEMDGYTVCRRLKADPATQGIPVIFVSSVLEEEETATGFALGAVDYLTKPVNPILLLTRVRTQLELAGQRKILETEVERRTRQLEKSQAAMREAMQNLLTVQIAPGVFWLQVPEAGLYILCGCPGEVVKHLMRKGFINQVMKDGVPCETGPNAILLSEVLVQNGGFANLAEFPVLQMLYRQGMILPGHPNNTGIRPLLMGAAEQVAAQLAYIYRGNYGLVSKEELMAAGVSASDAEMQMRIKLKFAFGAIRPTADLVDSLVVAEEEREIRNGVTVQRTGFNRYAFAYRGKRVEVDLTLPTGVSYPCPYPLGHHYVNQQYFAVLHIGEGDGWDVDRPSMGSLVMFQGRTYLVDAHPGIVQALTALGIDISEVDGIFQTHAHDDHFAGLPALIAADRKLHYYATPMVRASVAKKFAALMSLEEEEFGQFFQIHDLVLDRWNDCDGLEVKPIYSPHPLETTLFMFRALDGGGYRTYAHWADLSSMKVLDSMTGTGPDQVPASFMAKVKADYFLPADIKKLDIGGGMIHGVADDFRQDPSGRLILAHIARPLTPFEMEIGSESSFGAMDVLISGHQDYQRRQAFKVISALFPKVRKASLQMLANTPIELLNPGTLLYRRGETRTTVDLVLSGGVALLDAQEGICNHISQGAMIGLYSLFDPAIDTSWTYRALSHCTLLRIPVALMRAFLEQEALWEELRGLAEPVAFLRRTWLFGENTTFARLVEIARNLEVLTHAAGSHIAVGPQRELHLVARGRVRLENGSAQALESIGRGGFFGEQTRLCRGPDCCPWTYVAEEETQTYRLRAPEVMEIPVVHWKMLEIYEKRRHKLPG